MAYKFRGNLCGYLCENYSEALEGATVLLYLPWQKERITETAVASTKDTFRLVSEAEQRERANLLIGKAVADAGGNFEIEVEEQYAKSAFDIDFECGTVPHKIPKPKQEPVQFHLTTVFPQWRAARQEEGNYYFQWNYCIAARWWCYIRGYHFDAWVILGHLYVCDTKTPIPGVKVTAMDADFFTDDNLGSAITDASGFFRIDYSSIDFKQTFLSPWINIETEPVTLLSFVSGPDVYFKYEYNGVAIQGETAANRRNNVGYCLCVNLCLKDIVITPPPIPASFTKIGNAGNHFINETIASGNTNVIASGTGKTPAGQAFYSCIKLRGNLTQKLNGVAMEYSFDTVETAGPGSAIEIGNWQKVKASQLCSAIIGQFYTFTGDPFNPVSIVDYTVDQSSGMDANGWIAVPQAANFAPNTGGEILGFNTASLNANTVDMNGLIQGQSTTTKAPLQPNRFFKIRMIQRQVGNAATETPAGVSNPVAMFNTTYNNVPKYGSWMPEKANESGVACIDIQEMIGGGGGTGCTPITNAVHVNYTGANPNMGAASLILLGPGGPYTIQNAAPASNAAETASTAQELHNSADIIVPVADLANCAYTVKFSVELKLTNGEGQTSNIEDLMSFCKSEQ